MEHLLGWQPITEGDNIVGLFDVTGGGAISLSLAVSSSCPAPSSKPCTRPRRLMAHLAQCAGGGRAHRLPRHRHDAGWSRAAMPKMPKGRYKIMTAYMRRSAGSAST
jgi:glutamate--cysteine ligase